MVLFTIGVLWAIIGKVDIVATAEGNIIPGSRVKQIQPLEKGVVKTIFVKEGQSVKAGDPLIELDQALTQADQQRLVSELHYMQLNHQRLQMFLQLLSGTQTYTDTAVVDELFEKTIKDHQSTLSTSQLEIQRSQLLQQWLDFQAQLGALNSQLESRKAEKQSSQAIVEKLQATLPLVTKRANAVKSLLEQSLGAETQYLELEQQRIEQQQDLRAEQDRTTQLHAAIQEVKHRVSALQAEKKSQALLAIEDAERQVVSITQELNKAQDLNAKQILYAPVDGRVQQLEIHTVGGVVVEAPPLMRLVPKEDFLEVEATLENKDIGFVHVGKLAEIKVHTFPFTKYGIIDAEVINITADAVADEQKGLVYKMRLRMKSSQLYVNNQWVDLLPGMLVSAEVKTGHRRLIEFVMAPLLRYKQESGRER
jgi:hemolysin D